MTHLLLFNRSCVRMFCFSTKDVLCCVGWINACVCIKTNELISIEKGQTMRCGRIKRRAAVCVLCVCVWEELNVLEWSSNRILRITRTHKSFFTV